MIGDRMNEAFIYLLLGQAFQWLALGLVLRRLGKLEIRERERERGRTIMPTRSWPRR